MALCTTPQHSTS